MPVMKRSRQRDAILAYLKGRVDHPTADVIYTSLQKTIPNISLGTVYRNLSLLADHEMILRISCNGTADHFDATTHPHPHFFCNVCGRVEDIPAPFAFEPSAFVPPEFQGRITGCNVLYYGTCKHCLKPGDATCE